MVSIGAARVVLLLAGLWRAPEETEVRRNLEHGTPTGSASTMCSQTRRILVPDLSTGVLGGLANLLATVPTAEGHVRASLNNTSQRSAPQPGQDAGANMSNFARISNDFFFSQNVAYYFFYRDFRRFS